MDVRPDDARLSWQGAISVEHAPEGSRPWRLPHDKLALFPPDVLQDRAAMPAGVRLTFRSDTALVAGRVAPQEETTSIDLYVDGELQGSAPLAGVGHFRFDGIQAHGPKRVRLIELWLPQFGRFELQSLELSEGAMLAGHEEMRPRWITYGSSITHCRAAASPSQTWPAIAARRRGYHLTSLGFGGQCHLDSMVARVIRDQPADFLSMKVGINIYGSGSLNARSFQPAIIGFVQTVREKHPDTPYVVLSPIYSPPREQTKNRVDFTLADMREEVAAAVEALRSQGDRNVHYVSGLELFDEPDAHLLPDELHPNAEGYRLMGERFAEKVAAQYFR
jgi:hypothetical protein